MHSPIEVRKTGTLFLRNNIIIINIIIIDEIMEERMKDKFMNEYYRRLRLVLKSKLNGRNKFQARNTWAGALLRYGAGVMTWRRHELQGMDRTMRKLLTMHALLISGSYFNSMWGVKITPFRRVKIAELNLLQK